MIPVAAIVYVVAIIVFYWMKNKQRERRAYYTDRFEYILKELCERLRNQNQ